MISDPIIISTKDYNKANLVLTKLKNERIILIGGGSGTKKSELANSLQKVLYDNKKSSLVISLDDYYLTHATIRNINRKKLGLDSIGLSEIDWEFVFRIYEDFQNKKILSFKRTHRFLDAIEHNSLESLEIDIIIFEGLYSNYLRKFYSNNFSIFLEGTPQQTLSFRKIRQKENENDDFRQKIVQKEFNVVVQLKRYADLIMPFDGE